MYVSRSTRSSRWRRVHLRERGGVGSACANPKNQIEDWFMKSISLLAALFISTSAFAQSAAPKAGAPSVGDKPLVQVKPKAPIGCKLVGTVKGTKLWAGDCAASEPSSAAETTPPLAAQAVGAIPSGQK